MAKATQEGFDAARMGHGISTCEFFDFILLEWMRTFDGMFRSRAAAAAAL